MDSKEQIPKPEESIDEIEMDSNSSVDDFIKELEAKEKDLHITADLTIEIEESEFDLRNTPDFVPEEIMSAPVKSAATVKSGHSTESKTRIYGLEKEIEKLRKKISDIRSERNETQEKSDRRLKDFESYKYRMDRERRGSFIGQISNLALQLLPALDNLDRALHSAESIDREMSAEFQQFYNGIVLVNQQVNEVLAEMGVEPIKTVDETFDPNFHEAVAIDEGTDLPPNTISAEMLRGYRIGNRVIRHSMVKVTAAPMSPKTDTVEVTGEESTSDEEDSLSVEATNDSVAELEQFFTDPTDAPELDPSSTEAE